MISHDDSAERNARLTNLVWLAVCSCVIYAFVLVLSRDFRHPLPLEERPIIAVLVFFFAAFLVYLIAIRTALRATQDRRLVGVILVSSVAMRLVLLPSTPVQEVDIYRYLWDGVTSSRGINPFRYSPQQVLKASPQTETDADLALLARLSREHAPLGEILRRVHKGELTTVYPPVSQAVFSAVAFTTRTDASARSRLIVMKIWLLAFDMATLGLVVWLLRATKLPLGLSVVYGWCPLLLKEVANSGHLDTIATFLTMLAICLVVRLAVPWPATRIGPVWIAVGASLALALAVGAKLYPIVLAPLVAAALARRLGWRATIPAGFFLSATVLVLYPMFLPTGRSDVPLDERPAGVAEDSVEPVQAGQSSRGLTAFLTRWEMNDFLFLLVIENLRDEQVAWFSVVPDQLREAVVGRVPTDWVPDRFGAAFLVARAITLLVFAGVASWLLWRSICTDEVTVWLESAFLTLAWFWLLSPTLNPWYWTWVLPLLPWARNRVWLAVSGLVLIYYLRFWFAYHYETTPVLGTPYAGIAFFDLVVTWIEFGPWFLCLLISWAYRKSRGRAGGPVENSVLPGSKSS